MFDLADPASAVAPGPSALPVVEQGALSVVCNVAPERLPELRRLLKAAQAEIDEFRTNGVPSGPFAGTPGLHFARLVLLEPASSVGAPGQGSELVMTTCHDGPLGPHLNLLCKRGADVLGALFSCCVGFDSGARTDAAGRVRDFMERRRVKTDAFFVAARRRTVEQVIGEAELARRIGAFLDRRGSASGDVLGAVRVFVASEPDLRWALQPPVSRSLSRAEKAKLLGAWTLRAAPDFALTLRRLGELRSLERDDGRAIEERPEQRRTGAGRLYGELDWQALARARERAPAPQNAMSLVAAVKPGLLRERALSRTLDFVDLLGKLNCDNGQLAGITTIHFARWFFLPGRKRLFFESNYDGGWDAYLGDFIERASWGVSGIWGHTEGFPEVRYLFLDGAKDEKRFKEFTRANEVRTDVWYGAYPDLSATTIARNSFIRLALTAELTAEQRRAWQRAL